MFWKRLFDIVAAFSGLALLALPLCFLSLAIKLSSSGPIFFRQVRVGMGGREFRILKFRTMRVDAEKLGLQITVGRDPRITKLGFWLRKYKLDELPQLLNVLFGDMSFVGPRPEVPRYVDCYPPREKEIVLSVRPGITDLASIEFRDENALLEGVANPDEVYRTKILPEKLRLCVKYVETRTLRDDLNIIFRTLFAVAR